LKKIILNFHKRTKRIEKIGRRIQAVCGSEIDFNWEFCLIDGPILNAFCLPGGLNF
jgi:predicted Zn-dependent protease